MGTGQRNMRHSLILIVDDDQAVTASLALLLKQAQYRTVSAASPDRALELLAEHDVDLVIQDMNFSRRTSGEEGIKLLRRIKSKRPHVPVVLITAWASVELAVRGVKAGAADFVTKPWSHEQILHSVGTALGLAEAGFDESELPSRTELDADHDFDHLIGEDPRFRRVLSVVARVATTEASVLITGESGTGKELVAEAVWRNSHRRTAPFVKVNLGGIPTPLFESELFGHVKGAFTDAHQHRIGRFEAAHGGSLFLDEVGDLDIGNQVKLLRVLQDRSFEKVGSSTTIAVDVRVISATNRDLGALIDSGAFREDLLYRLNLIAVHLPTLRERRTDIPLLAGRFLEGVATTYRRPSLGLATSAIDWMSAQPWPGNIRQLKHLIERTVLLTTHDALCADDFVLATRSAAEDGPETPEVHRGSDPMTLEAIERQAILAAITRRRGNLTRVADELGLSRGALYRRLEKHGIDV